MSDSLGGETVADISRGGDSAEGAAMTPLARRYYDVAVSHQQSAAMGDPAETGNNAAIAVFFALAALEAYLPELRSVGGPMRDDGPINWTAVDRALAVRKRAGRKNEVERQFASAAPAVAVRQPWYRACRCLRRLRNGLLHYDSEFQPLGGWPEKVERGDCRGVIRGLDQRYASWANQVLTPGVAAWACAVVRETIEWFHSCVGGLSPWVLGRSSRGVWSELPRGVAPKV